MSEHIKARWHFQKHFSNENSWNWIKIFIEICSKGFNLQLGSIGSGGKDIARTNGDLLHWRIYASPGLNVLTELVGIILLYHYLLLMSALMDLQRVC